jgi:anaerobic ribonucleoside-triphosphate reductase
MLKQQIATLQNQITTENEKLVHFLHLIHLNFFQIYSIQSFL